MIYSGTFLFLSSYGGMKEKKKQPASKLVASGIYRQGCNSVSLLLLVVSLGLRQPLLYLLDTLGIRWVVAEYAAYC